MGIIGLYTINLVIPIADAATSNISILIFVGAPNPAYRNRSPEDINPEDILGKISKILKKVKTDHAQLLEQLSRL